MTTNEISVAKETATRAGLTIYAESHDGCLWVSGLERWLTPTQVVAHAAIVREQQREEARLARR